jgi:hypothetical protein
LSSFFATTVLDAVVATVEMEDHIIVKNMSKQTIIVGGLWRRVVVVVMVLAAVPVVFASIVRVGILQQFMIRNALLRTIQEERWDEVPSTDKNEVRVTATLIIVYCLGCYYL